MWRVWGVCVFVEGVHKRRHTSFEHFDPLPLVMFSQSSFDMPGHENRTPLPHDTIRDGPLSNQSIYILLHSLIEHCKYSAYYGKEF